MKMKYAAQIRAAEKNGKLRPAPTTGIKKKITATSTDCKARETAKDKRRFDIGEMSDISSK